MSEVALKLQVTLADLYGQIYALQGAQKAYEEWLEKTEFVQEWMNEGKLPAQYLGWHRADILRDLIARGEKIE